jgi:hypothetical protein
MAPIPGLAVPNGYTDPTTGLGFSCAPPSAMSASPSIANSSAMDMTTMRQGSTFSTGSFSSGSRPATPTMGYPSEPTANTTTQGQGQQYQPAPSTMSATGMGMVIKTNTSPAPIEPNRNLSVTNNMSNMPSFNTDPFNSAASSARSVSDAHTPQTSASSNTVGSGMHTADETAHSFQAEHQSFGGYGAVSNGYRAVNAPPSNDVHHTRSMDYFAADVDFGSFSDQEREEAEAEAEEWDDAGDC